MLKNGIAAREDFDQACFLYANSMGLEYDQVKSLFRPTQSRLRMELVANTATNNYQFQVLKNQGGSQFPTEQLLNLQDGLVPTSVGFYFADATGATDTAFSLYTYLNPAVFGAAARPMGTIYNGNFTITASNNQYVTSWPAMWHKYVPQTQQTSAPGAGSPLDEFDGAEYGQVTMQPFVLLIGTQNIQISLNIPAAPTQVLANSRLVLTFDGFLFKNSTPVS